MKKIRNVFCVGRNYQEHIDELANERPVQPVWFMKPSHSLVSIQDSERIILPNELGKLHYEVEVVVQMQADYLPDQPLSRLIGKVALGLDLTLRDLQGELKTKGLPWLRAKGFRNSAIISDSLPYASLSDFTTTHFYLEKNAEVVQKGQVSDMIFSLEELLKSCWEQFDLKKGDIIFTGTPAGVGEIDPGDVFKLYLNDGCLGQVTVEKG